MSPSDLVFQKGAGRQFVCGDSFDMAGPQQQASIVLKTEAGLGRFFSGPLIHTYEALTCAPRPPARHAAGSLRQMHACLPAWMPCPLVAARPPPLSAGGREQQNQASVPSGWVGAQPKPRDTEVVPPITAGPQHDQRFFHLGQQASLHMLPLRCGQGGRGFDLTGPCLFKDSTPTLAGKSHEQNG